MSIFDPNERGSVQNKGSGGSNISTTRQVINAIFGRTPLFYNSGLGDVISPTIDANLYYPLAPTSQFQEKTVTAINLDTRRFFWQPPRTKHWMVYFLNASDTHAVPKTGVSITTSLNIINRTPIVLSEIHLNPTAVPVNIPIIGGYATVYDATIPAAPLFSTFQGMKSLYLNNNMILLVTYDGVIDNDIVRSQIVYLELPENQPFGSVLTL